MKDIAVDIVVEFEDEPDDEDVASVYTGFEDLLEDDEISSEEAGFLLGYKEAE